jgi:hypothetical protein
MSTAPIPRTGRTSWILYRHSHTVAGSKNPLLRTVQRPMPGTAGGLLLGILTMTMERNAACCACRWREAPGGHTASVGKGQARACVKNGDDRLDRPWASPPYSRYNIRSLCVPWPVSYLCACPRYGRCTGRNLSFSLNLSTLYPYASGMCVNGGRQAGSFLKRK